MIDGDKLKDGCQVIWKQENAGQSTQINVTVSILQQNGRDFDEFPERMQNQVVVTESTLIPIGYQKNNCVEDRGQITLK